MLQPSERVTNTGQLLTRHGSVQRTANESDVALALRKSLADPREKLFIRRIAASSTQTVLCAPAHTAQQAACGSARRVHVPVGSREGVDVFQWRAALDALDVSWSQRTRT